MVSSRRRFLRSGVAIGTTTGLAGCLGGDRLGFFGDGDTQDVRAAAADGGSAESMLQALTRVVDDESDEVRLLVESTPGDPATLRRFDSGDIDAPAITNWPLVLAWNDEEMFEEEPIEDFPNQGLQLMLLNLHWAATADSGIETTDDLVGRPIFPLPGGWGLRNLTETIHKEIGMWEDLSENVVELSVTDTAGAVDEGRIEAFMSYFSNEEVTPWAKEVDARADLMLPEPTDEWAQGVENTQGPVLMDHPTDGYDQDVGLDQVATAGLGVQLMFGDHVPNDAVYELARVSHENTDRLQEAMEAYPNHSNIENMYNLWVTDPEVPVHPGMADFLEDNDHWDGDTYTRADS